MNNLLEKDKENIWHPFTPLLGAIDPILITKASGLYLHTEDGRKIMDMISSWYVNLHGHSNPTLAAAIAEQASRLEHVIFAGFTHEPAIKLSEQLLSILPSDHKKIFFSDNGSTAVEVALKIAFQFWHNQGFRKPRIIALEGAYHGDTFGSMSVGARGMFTDPWRSHLFETDFIPFPDSNNASLTIEHFIKLIKQNDVGAFIYEPLIQATAGMRVYSPEVLQYLLELAQQHNIICIADEVFTGFGRTGKMFAGNYITHMPDIVCLSKGLTGGFLPLGATSVSKKIITAFETIDFEKTLFHGHSYTANPLACTAANTSIEILNTTSCQNAINRIVKSHEKFRNQISGKYKKLKEVRQLGTMIAFELRVDKEGYNSDIRNLIYKFFLSKNILIRPLGHVFYLLPPYIITEDELWFVYQTIEKFLISLE